MPFGSPDGASDRTAHVDLTFSEADEQFRTEFRSWLDANLPKEWRERGFWRRRDSDQAFEMRRTWEAEKAKAGFAGIQWPKEYGGRGGTPTMRAIYDEEMVRHRAPMTVNSLGLTFLAPTVMVIGTDEQKRDIINAADRQAQRGRHLFVRQRRVLGQQSQQSLALLGQAEQRAAYRLA